MIQWLRLHQLPFAVRSGGHSFEGLSQSDSVVIDTRMMNAIDIDTASETVSVGPGVSLGAIYEAVGARGYASSGQLSHGRRCRARPWRWIRPLVSPVWAPVRQPQVPGDRRSGPSIISADPQQNGERFGPRAEVEEDARPSPRFRLQIFPLSRWWFLPFLGCFGRPCSQCREGLASLGSKRA